MEQKERFRHELKYEITYEEYLSLRSRLKQVMKSDSHARDDGRYRIRSIYFDNIYDKALLEKVNGAVFREKFRIRYYNDDCSYLLLEKKIKNNHLCRKVSKELTREECDSLLSPDAAFLKRQENPLAQELRIKMKTQLLRPRVMVSYLREPYIYAAGNVRITFDSDIRTSLFARQFFHSDRHDICAADVPGVMILEIKYDDFLPEIISHMVQSGRIRVQAFSKYAICRRFG